MRKRGKFTQVLRSARTGVHSNKCLIIV